MKNSNDFIRFDLDSNNKPFDDNFYLKNIELNDQLKLSPPSIKNKENEFNEYLLDSPLK